MKHNLRAAGSWRKHCSGVYFVENTYDARYDGIMLRLVIDTDVLLSAFMSPSGASRQLVMDALDGKFRLLLSTSLLLEYEAVLRRPQNLQQTSASEPEVTEVLDALAGVCVPVLFDYQWRPTGAHADDELVMETAINGQADAVATFNLRDMDAAARKFGFQALRPATVLRRLRL